MAHGANASLGRAPQALTHSSASVAMPRSKEQSKGQTEQTRFLRLQPVRRLLENLWFINVTSSDGRWGSSPRRTRKP